MHVSLIIRALNEAEHLPTLLDAVDRQTERPDEVILVDSGSTDGSVEIAEAHGARVVHIPPGDFTFGGALNLGCETAKGEILVFASAHVYPIDDTWLARLTAPFSNSAVGLTYGRQTGDDRTTFSEQRLFESWFPDVDNHDQDHAFCNNANAAIRRSRWEDFPYDEALPGLEDIAWATKLRQRGGTVAYVADATVAHIHEEHFRQTLNRYRREAIAHRSFSGVPPMPAKTCAGLAVRHISADVRAALTTRQLSAIPAIAAFRTAQFAGVWLAGRTPVSDTDKIVQRMYYPRPK